MDESEKIRWGICEQCVSGNEPSDLTRKLLAIVKENMGKEWRNPIHIYLETQTLPQSVFFRELWMKMLCAGCRFKMEHEVIAQTEDVLSNDKEQ